MNGASQMAGMQLRICELNEWIEEVDAGIEITPVPAFLDTSLFLQVYTWGYVGENPALPFTEGSPLSPCPLHLKCPSLLGSTCLQ